MLTGGIHMQGSRPKFILQLIAGLTLFTTQSTAQPPRFTTIDVPNSVFTVARAVNSAGAIVGWFIDDTAFKHHGYLRSADGQITQVDFNNDPAQATEALGLSDAGDIVGDYRDTAGRKRGFLLSGGTFSSFDPPGSFSTVPHSINSNGDIVGFFSDNSGTGLHGFLVNKNNLSSFTILDFPGATYSLATAINDSGEIVGLHGDSNFVDHGFVRSPAGLYSALKDAPGVDTDPWGISNSGLVAGFYDEFGGAALVNGFTLPNGRDFPTPKALFHAFVLQGDSLTLVNISGVGGGINTGIFGIRDDGVIVGQYNSPDGHTHGFVGTPK